MFLPPFFLLLPLLSTHPTPVTAYINYSTVPGLFLQDLSTTNTSTFNFAATNFGLINRTYPSDSTCPEYQSSTQWQRFAHYVATLNAQTGPSVRYTLLYMGRHGEGYHNTAESYFGTPGWNCYWAEFDGNSTVTWADAHLTPNGVKQALSVNAFWKHEIVTQMIPVPQRYYTSPLTRCLQTANLSFIGLDLPRKYPFIPEVKELFRESISAHTCDRRSSKTYIHANFPHNTFEPSFTEYDELWEALHAETNTDQDNRSKTVLDEVFSADNSTYISITSHSGEISSILRVLGHQVFGLSTGAVIPVLVRAETLEISAPTSAYQTFTAVKTCAYAPTITAASCDDCSCCS